MSSKRTSIFTLPQEQPQENATTSQYEEFPSPTSPSLPWFVEYWSSTFFQTPAMVFDQLCACSSASAVHNTTALDESMLMHDDDTSTFRFDLSHNQIRLRQVVASQDQSFAEDSTLWAGNTADSKYYPTKQQYFPTIRKSSILFEDEDSDSDSILDMDEDDASRDAAPALIKDPTKITKATPIMDASSISCGADSSGIKLTVEDYSSRMLYTCESFDHFIRGKNSSNGESSSISCGIPVPPQPQQPGSEMVFCMDTPPNHIRQRLQPPNSPGATTCTTVSLTQSFMKEFDDDADGDDDDDDDSLMGGEKVDAKEMMERWNQSSSQLFRGLDNNAVEEEAQQQQQESPEDQCCFQTPPSSPSRKWMTAEPPAAPSCRHHHEAYRYLIRMKPQNYVHDSNGGMEEEKKGDEGDDDYYYLEFINNENYLPSHEQLNSNMTFREAFYQTMSPPPTLPSF
jgi:hypothetical protein